MSLLSSVTRSIKHESGNSTVRMRVMSQLELLSSRGYLKARFKSTASMRRTPSAFEAAFMKTLKASNIAAGCQRLVLHSMVVTMLLALGDEPTLRKRVGVMLEKKSRARGIAFIFQTFPLIYSQALANLPPQPTQDTLSLSLLRCIPQLRSN